MKLASVLLMACSALPGQVSMSRYDNSRDGWTSTNASLTTSNVLAGKFGLRGAYTINGNSYAQPIIVPNVTVGGKVYNLLIAATMSCHVTAFDADAPGSSSLWDVTLCTPWSTYPTNGGEQLYYGVAVGCMSTPTTDQTYLYVVCTSNTAPHNWTAYKLNLTDGTTALSVTLTGTVAGTGDPNGGGVDCVSGGVLTFCPQWELNRPGLLLLNGTLYAFFGSYDDVPPWHGWGFGVRVSDMTIQYVNCFSPNGEGAAVWFAGGASTDGTSIFVATGNGDCGNVSTGGYSEGILRLNQNLTIADWFQSSTCAAMTSSDEDLSAGPFLANGLVTAAAKDGRIYSMLTSCLGHVGGTVGCTPQIFSSGDRIMNVVYANGVGYFSRTNLTPASDVVSYFSLSGSTWNTTATNTANLSFFPGAVCSASSNGASNTILWCVTVSAYAAVTAQAGTLHAYNTSLTELWNSGVDGNMSKYTPPVVNGPTVYSVTQSGTIQAFGLLPSTTLTGLATITGQAELQ